MSYGWCTPGAGGAWWVITAIAMMVFWVVVVAGVVILVRHFTASRGVASSAGRSNRALDILDERFARGEMSEDDYVHQRALLKDES